MCRRATARAVSVAIFATLSWCFSLPAWGQTSSQGGLGWRRVGNSAMQLALPSLATGAVDRVWYSADGSNLYAKTASGRVFQTSDFEQWQLVADPKMSPPAEETPSVSGVPEAGIKLASARTGGRLYGVGRQAYRSDDGGQAWINLTAYKGDCILGTGLASVAVSPGDPDDVTIGSATGVWRSVDGGLSWTGLNDFLPNLPSGHLLGLPIGTRGVRLAVASNSAAMEWAPGEKTAWKPMDATDLVREQNLKGALSLVLKHSVTAIATAKDYIYAGDSEGRLRVSSDAGASWGPAARMGEWGKVEAIWVDSNDPRVAIAALSAANRAGDTTKPSYVLRTMNGGGFWDDITANLPETAVAHGVTADRTSGAIYLATDAGIFSTATDLGSAGRPGAWASLSGNLPAAAATDVKLDAGGNQLYAALDGYGVYTAIAPHRLRDARVVSAADYSARPAAPGALLSVLGARVESAKSDADVVAPVLDASNIASQIQVPFSATGNMVSLSLNATQGALTFQVPLRSVSPAIFVDPEGTPLIMDAGSGVLLDASKPAHASSRIQVLATGLGQVNPNWPTGLEAPLKDPPRVAATVHAYLDGSPVEVTQASLAPGYVGFYLIEIQIPRITNTGPSELYLDAEGQQSNRVRLYVEQ
jgi:uncharacterized protein (TIGR03437 family)